LEEDRGGNAQALTLRLVIFGGEALDISQLQPWFERHGDEQPRLVNMYGITETTVHVTYRELRAEDVKREARGGVIGAPLPDLQLYLLDRHLQPLPIGVAGEMYVGGEGLARGYLGRPDLTAEKFVADPYGRKAGGRLYRSGDKARRLPDGDIEYLGRLDEQVKIRGFRIELGEIETVLSQSANVRDCVVIAREERPDERQLVAYVVGEEGRVPSVSQLRQHLRERLPDYMLPSVFVLLDELPLTPNGKLDRRRLPAPNGDSVQSSETYLAPRSEAEQTIAAVWQEVLQLEGVGINDNFFDLGGHSLLMLRVHSKLRSIFKHEMSIVEMFRYPTVGAQAARLQEGLGEQPSFHQSEERAALSRRAIKRRRELRKNQ
jgi:acyl carrier protein